MAVINLIAQEQQIRRQLERKTRVLGFSWLSVAGVIGAGWASLLLYGSSLNAQRAGRSATRATASHPATTQADAGAAGRAQPPIETLQNARKDTGRWQKLFQHFSQHTPQGCYLTGESWANAQTPKSRWKSRLRESPRISKSSASLCCA